jgi:acetyl/propionyl-CoA carboxylase alpha subunit
VLCFSAEDPIRNFLPSIGPLVSYIEPEIYRDENEKEVVRIDTGPEYNVHAHQPAVTKGAPNARGE